LSKFTMPASTQLSTLLRPLVDRFVSDIENTFRAAALEAVQSSLGLSGPTFGRASNGAKGRPPIKVSSARPAKQAASAPVAAKEKPRAAKGKPQKGVRIRRSNAQIEATMQKILAYVRANPNQGAESIKSVLGLKTLEWGLPVARLLKAKQLVAKGEKRSRTYAAASR
jgi:hypothetical protein